MNEALNQKIADLCAPPAVALKKRVQSAVTALDELLILEEHLRDGHSDLTRLKNSVGSLGGVALNVEAVSEVLKKGDSKRLMSEQRYDRITKLLESLKKIKKELDKAPLTAEFQSFKGDIQKICGDFDNHANKTASIIREIRIANLESRADYTPEVHDSFFAHFDWTSLSDSEASLIPPFIVSAGFNGNSRWELLSQIIPLLGTGRPLKVVLARSTVLPPDAAGGRATALRSPVDVESLPLVLRKCFFAQSSLNDSEAMAAWLASLRPALLSVFVPKENEPETGFESRFKRAVAARAFPVFIYDPDASRDFVKRITLLDNPDLDKTWTVCTFKYRDPSGKEHELEREYTFADYAADEGICRDEFKTLSGEVKEQNTVPVARYFSLPPAERAGKVPVVYALNGADSALKLVPSPSLLIQTADRMQLWQALRELAGIDNPYVKERVEEAEQRAAEESERALSEVRSKLLAEAKERERTAVARAMGNLARKLAGMGGKDALAGTLLGKTESASAGPSAPVPEAKEAAPEPHAAESPAAGSGDLPWIDSPECTSCDDCITLNNKIFGYNSEKKATIVNPRGGPFRDIVKAAEKCPAMIIHPGSPQDPNEKDLKKWIKRAEPFQ